MKTCKNCYWYEKCEHEKRCEYYDPVYGSENILLKEYNAALEERVQDYQEELEEQNS